MLTGIKGNTIAVFSIVLIAMMAMAFEADAKNNEKGARPDPGTG